MISIMLFKDIKEYLWIIIEHKRNIDFISTDLFDFKFQFVSINKTLSHALCS